MHSFHHLVSSKLSSLKLLHIFSTFGKLRLQNIYRISLLFFCQTIIYWGVFMLSVWFFNKIFVLLFYCGESWLVFFIQPICCNFRITCCNHIRLRKRSHFSWTVLGIWNKTFSMTTFSVFIDGRRLVSDKKALLGRRTDFRVLYQPVDTTKLPLINSSGFLWQVHFRASWSRRLAKSFPSFGQVKLCAQSQKQLIIFCLLSSWGHSSFRFASTSCST